jgi:hypothetical protein
MTATRRGPYTRSLRGRCDPKDVERTEVEGWAKHLPAASNLLLREASDMARPLWPSLVKGFGRTLARLANCENDIAAGASNLAHEAQPKALPEA